MKPASPGAPYTVPPEPSRIPAIVLAVAVHALLLAFLYFGISWQSKTPVTVEAEVWDMKVETAAAPPLPAPEPEPQPAPEPEPAPAPTPPPAPKVVEPEPVKPAAPDIALEREKQRKLELAKKERERELAEQKEREELKRKEIAEQKQREEQKRKELAEQKQREEQKAREEQKKKELAEKKKEEEKKLAAEQAAAEKKKLADAKAKAAAEKAQLDKLRDLELKRIAGAAGTAGNAEKSSAPKVDAGYVARLTALIKSNTTYAGSTDQPGNPKASFRVELLPTGEILSVRLIKSSGVPQFDDAVERGINKSSPLPKKKDGTVERNLVVNFSMKDLD
ncbi:cell envelope integrity protein TolA [Telluria sp. B2]